ncbi:MAG: flagellar basal body L-ring protein FlgH [Craterilacuibacter sp.]
MRVALLSLLCLSACAQLRLPPEPEPELPPVPAMAPKGTGGGVFSAYGVAALVADRRAFRPGDVLTVVLEETTQASKRAGTQFDKTSGVEFTPTVIGNKAYQTTVGIDAARNFDGAASSSQQNSLAGSLTVVVQQVLPGGLMLVKGEKQLTLNQGEEFLRLAGYVRLDDVDSTNRVSSQRIANARISYAGRGALSDANAPGWLTRVFNSPWMPF